MHFTTIFSNLHKIAASFWLFFIFCYFAQKFTKKFVQFAYWRREADDRLFVVSLPNSRNHLSHGFLIFNF